jgi:hypothetical protein
MRARGNVAAGQDESTIVQLDEVAAPLCARLGADHYEDGRGGDLFTLAGPDVLERQGFQAGLAVAVGNSGAEPDFDVGGRLQLGDGVVGQAGGQRLAPYEQRDPGRRIWPGAGRPDRLSLPANDAHLLSGHGVRFDVGRTGPGS